MIVGVDIMDLRLAETGQKTHLEELCRQFKIREDKNIQFRFLDSPFRVYKGRNKFRLILEHLKQQCWKQILLPVTAWYHKCDIVYCSDYFAPYLHLGYKTVQVFHDAFFFETPEHYNALWLKMFRWMAIPAARRSSFIITPSFYAQKTVHAHSGIPLEKIIPIHLGPKTFTRIENKATLPEWLSGLIKQRYFLHIGVFEKRKNLPRLVKAFSRIHSEFPDIKLVLAGKCSGKLNSEDYHTIISLREELQLENAVLLPGYVPDELLETLYQNAFLYVFPSLNEGFGIPLLEAFRTGIPAIVANNSTLPEIGADAVLAFDPYDEVGMYQKMKEVITNQELRLHLIEKGKERIHLFSWEKAATEFINVFKLACTQKSK